MPSSTTLTRTQTATGQSDTGGAFLKAPHQEAYNRVVAERSELAVNLLAFAGACLDFALFASRQNLPQSVSADNPHLRLRLDEGGGEVLKNSAPHAQQAVFPLENSSHNGGDDGFSLIDAASTHTAGQTGDYEGKLAFFRADGSWCALRPTTRQRHRDFSKTILASLTGGSSIESGLLSAANEAPRFEGPQNRRGRQAHCQKKSSSIQPRRPYEEGLVQRFPGEEISQRQEGSCQNWRAQGTHS